MPQPPFYVPISPEIPLPCTYSAHPFIGLPRPSYPYHLLTPNILLHTYPTLYTLTLYLPTHSLTNLLHHTYLTLYRSHPFFYVLTPLYIPLPFTYQIHPHLLLYLPFTYLPNSTPAHPFTYLPHPTYPFHQPTPPTFYLPTPPYIFSPSAHRPYPT